MNDINILKDYLPVVTAFIGAFLAYIFNDRKYNHERFFDDVSESLRGFYSPVFHELRLIQLEIDAKNREDLIGIFIKKYTKSDTMLYTCHNEYLVQLFYDLDEVFKIFMVKRREEDWEKVWKSLMTINSLVKKEYWLIQRSLYKEYPWKKVTCRRNYLIRPLMELSVFLFHTACFIMIAWLFLLYLISFDKFFGQSVLPAIILANFIIISKLVLAIYLLSLSLAIPYLIIILDHKRITITKEKINKYFIAIVKKVFKREKEAKRNIPEMYIKKELNTLNNSSKMTENEI